MESNDFYDKISNLSIHKKIQIYLLIFLVVLSFSTLIPNMILKKPCRTDDEDKRGNCSILSETNEIGLMKFKQNKYLGLYSMNILTGCLCFIISIILIIYIILF